MVSRATCAPAWAFPTPRNRAVRNEIVIASAAKQSTGCKKVWIAHMGNVCVKDEQAPFCSTAATSSSRPRAVQDGARRSSQGRPFRAAAQRLGLELSEHVILRSEEHTSELQSQSNLVCRLL